MAKLTLTKETRQLFVSYRGSQKNLAVEISQAAKAAGWTAKTIVEYAKSPYPAGSALEAKWLTDYFAERITPGCTFVILVSEDIDESHWILWEAVEGFTKAYRIIVCWLGGSNPLQTIFPLPRWAYRIIDSPQSFIIDVRGQPRLATPAIMRILSPSRRYHFLLRLQQASTLFVSLALLILPVSVVITASALPEAAGAAMRSLLLRPWVCLAALWMSVALTVIFYPSYGGPIRLDRQAIDRRIRLITPGFTGWRWHRFIFPLSFVLICAAHGISLFALKKMAEIPFRVFIEAGALALVVRFGYERFRWNAFTVHLGKIYRKLAKHYGLSFEQMAAVRKDAMGGRL